MAKKIERKYLAHFLDAAFGEEPQNYVRLGADLEEYNEELNPDVETKKNILGENSVVHNGYEVSSEVEPFYAYYDDPLFEQLAMIANERKTGSDCKTTKVDVLLAEDGIIRYSGPASLAPAGVYEQVDGILAPGFVDIHCHAAGQVFAHED